MIRRLLPSAWAVAASIGLGAVVLGARGRTLPFAGAALVAAAAGTFVVTRRDATADAAWTRSDPLAPGTPRRPAASPLRTARALAGAEGRELLSSGWFAAGVGLWALVVVRLGVLDPDAVAGTWTRFTLVAALVCHPFTGPLVVAAHAARTRERRDRSEELFRSCPASRATRTLGHLATAWVGALVNLAGLVLLLGCIALRGAALDGPVDGEVIATALLCGLLGLGGVALGVALTRIGAWAAVPVGAVIAIAVVDVQLNGIGRPGWSRARMLATGVAAPGPDPLFYERPTWARLVWFAGLTAAVVTLALARWRGPRPSRALTTACLGASLALAAVGGACVVQPMTRGAASVAADRLRAPLPHSRCLPAGPGVEVCAYEAYGGQLRRAHEAVAAVVGAVPPGTLRGRTYAQLEHRRQQLPAEVRTALGTGPVDVPDGTDRVPLDPHPAALDGLRARVAAQAVGLPSHVAHRAPPTLVAGQGRGVVLLWLATRGLDRSGVRRLLPPDPPGADATRRGSKWPGLCNGEDGVLLWSPEDIDAARALIDLPEARVRELVRTRWTWLVDPTTSTRAVLEALGLPTGARQTPVEARPYGCW